MVAFSSKMDLYNKISVLQVMIFAALVLSLDAAVMDVTCEANHINLVTTDVKLEEVFGNPWDYMFGFFVDNVYVNCSTKPLGTVSVISGTSSMSFHYEDCGVKVTRYYGDGHELLQYGVHIDGRLTGLNGTTDEIDPNSKNVSVPIDCKWNAHADVTVTPVNVNTEQTEAPPSGNTTQADRELSLNLVDPKTGKSLDSAHLSEGDHIRVNILLKKDSLYYLAEKPLTCTVTPVDPVGAPITTVSQGCPDKDTLDNSPFHFWAQQVDNQDYFFEFSAFTIDGRNTQLKIECDIRVCIQLQDCYQLCWNGTTYTIPAPTTAAPTTQPPTIRHLGPFLNNAQRVMPVNMKTATSTKHQMVNVMTADEPVTDQDQPTHSSPTLGIIVLGAVGSVAVVGALVQLRPKTL